MLTIDRTITFPRVCEYLRNSLPFSLSRFGDGEWHAILGHDGANCDKHQYFPEMGKALGDIVRKEQRYYLAYHLLRSDRIREEVEGWLVQNAPVHHWSDSAMFHHAYVEGTLGQLWKALAHRHVAVIGPHYMAEKILTLPFEVDTFIPVANENCWEDHEKMTNVLQMAPVFDVVLLASSMPACVWLDIGFERNEEATWIDVGCVLDPWIGNYNRSFTRKHYKQYGLKPTSPLQF